ncbi:MAG: MBL fold metallo-hydrolase [Tissierellia bacterium]|nr:MBL fold metallo-hydrolase [Tissierellia bacterium]
MVLEVYPDIYLLEIPLPNNPLRALNSYIIKSDNESLIIDTGFNMKECKDALMEGLEELNIDLNNCKLLISHLHSDHSGLAASLNQEGVKVYAGEIDGNMINDMTTEEYWKQFDDYKILFDLERDNISIDDHPGYKYCPKETVEFIPLKEGQILTIGDYQLEVIDIPGHTPGHIGLYERRHKLFFGGDHVLNRITPNISFWGFDQDILATYFESLKKVYDYPIDYLFSSHRSIVRDHRKRIEELLKHHQERLDEIREIIRDEKMTVRDVAAKMNWDLRYDNWEDFPSPQKWFASGETMSHLEHLVHIGEAEKTKENGILYYKLIG